MIVPIDALLRREAEAHRFVWSCERCAHFDEESPRCTLGFPHEPHRHAAWDEADLAFCKSFELA